jgi:hypothetical protein
LIYLNYIYISEVHVAVRHFTSQVCLFINIKLKMKYLEKLNFSYKNSRKFLIISVIFGYRMHLICRCLIYSRENSKLLFFVSLWYNSRWWAQGLLIIKASKSHLKAPQSLGLICTSDQPDTETSASQHTTCKRESYLCPGGI